jgi:Fic family protein
MHRLEGLGAEIGGGSFVVCHHPFDDGNGRIARALTDLLLVRADKSTQRFYSMSAQIRLE